MAEDSKIEWTDATFNPWMGCVKVSDGCKHCYAEYFGRRYKKAQWGPDAERVKTGEAYWKQPLAWDKKAAAQGTRTRVFCASLADVFEDNDQLVAWRAELFELIMQTRHLDWLLLTKRPGNVNDMVPAQWRNVNRWPLNVWVGTSVENQDAADSRIPELLRVPALTRFLSCEPLLGPVDLSQYLYCCPSCGAPRPERLGCCCSYCEEFPSLRGISWVIVGGESGPHARPMDPEWAVTLRDQCVAARVPYFFKQWGEWGPRKVWDKDGASLKKYGKFANGRELDGQVWSQIPDIA
jgi:protein gp37